VTELDLVDVRDAGRWFRVDRELSLPGTPRLIPELLVVPLGDDGLMLAGGAEPQVFRGRSARGLLLRLLPLLDGRRTLPELAERCPTVAPGDLRDVIGLLASRGVLEDGGTEAPPAELEDVAAFAGRMIDASRRHPHRLAVLGRLAASTVTVVGPATLAAAMAEELRAAGVGTVRSGGGAAGSEALTVVLSTGAAPERSGAHRPPSGGRTLLVRLGHDEAHLGPLLVDAVTACPSCVAAAHPHPDGEPDALRAAFWIGLAAHQAFLALSGLTPAAAVRGFRTQRFEGTALAEQDRLAVRLPGCARCGLPGPRWSPDDRRLVAWIHHAGTSLPPGEALSPREHQRHYRAEFARLAAGVATPPRGGSPRVSLAPGGPGIDRPRAATVTRPALAAVLARTAGYVNTGAGRRRVVPTGGNLGSVALWVIARDVVGLAPGVYLHDGAGEALEAVGVADDAELARALGVVGDLPPCVIVATGALAWCARKYGGFAYRLVHFDAGVALSYAHLTTRVLGLPVRELPGLGTELTALLGFPRRWEFPLTTFALAVGAPVRWASGCPAPPSAAGPPPPLTPDDHGLDVLPLLLEDAARPGPPADPPPPPGPGAGATFPGGPAGLDAAILARRSVRAFSPVPVSHADLEQVTAAMAAVRAHRAAAGAPRTSARPLLAVARGTDALPAGVYEVDPRTGAIGRRRGAFGPAEARACTNQSALAEAPASVVVVGNLRDALTARGARGYGELGIACGAQAGAGWLRATSLGLVGTLAGGVVAEGLRVTAGANGFDECPMPALHLGHPHPDGAT
jgi:Nitroreductase family